jgi:hypothetical protein
VLLDLNWRAVCTKCGMIGADLRPIGASDCLPHRHAVAPDMLLLRISGPNGAVMAQLQQCDGRAQGRSGSIHLARFIQLMGRAWPEGKP